MPGKSEKFMSRIWSSLYLAVKKFFQIDGPQWAGAFAFYAFFALFPLIILLVTFGSVLIDQGEAEKQVVAYVEGYIPISGEMQRYIFGAVEGVVDALGEAGAVEILMLV